MTLFGDKRFWITDILKLNAPTFTLQFISREKSLCWNLEEKREALACMIRQIDRFPEALIADLRLERLQSTVVGRIEVAYMSDKKSKEVMI